MVIEKCLGGFRNMMKRFCSWEPDCSIGSRRPKARLQGSFLGALLIAVIITLLSGGCLGSGTEGDEHADIGGLASSLYAIGLDVMNMVIKVESESIGGSHYLEEKDLVEAFELNAKIDRLEEELIPYLSTQERGSDSIVVAIAKEKLRQILIAIESFVLLRDAYEDRSLEYSDIHGLLTSRITSYSLAYTLSEAILLDKEDEELDPMELYGYLLDEYLLSVMDCYVLRLRHFDANVLKLEKEEVRVLFDSYRENIERVIAEMDTIAFPAYWEGALAVLAEVAARILDVNEYLFAADWDTVNQEELDRIYESTLVLTDEFYSILEDAGLEPY